MDAVTKEWPCKKIGLLYTRMESTEYPQYGSHMDHRKLQGKEVESLGRKGNR